MMVGVVGIVLGVVIGVVVVSWLVYKASAYAIASALW